VTVAPVPRAATVLAAPEVGLILFRVVWFIL